MLYQIENWYNLRDRFRKELDETVCRMKFGVDDINVPETVMIPVPDFEELSDEDLFSRLRALREPIGEKELKLIKQSGWRRFPPKLWARIQEKI